MSTLSNKKIIAILTILVFAFLLVGILRFFNLYEGLNSLPDLYDTIDMKSDRILKNASLKPGSYITSQNGNYRLSFDMMGVLSVKKLIINPKMVILMTKMGYVNRSIYGNQYGMLVYLIQKQEQNCDLVQMVI